MKSDFIFAIKFVTFQNINNCSFVFLISASLYVMHTVANEKSLLLSD